MTTVKRYMSQFQLKMALKYVQKALDLFPDDIYALTLAEDLCNDLNMYKESITYYRRHIMIAPDYRACHNMGNAFANADMEKEAVEAFEEALKFDPNAVSTLVNLGINLAILAQTDRALDAFNRIIEVAPNSPIGYCYRGMMFMTLLEHYRNALTQQFESERTPIKTEYRLRKDNYDQLLFEKRWNIEKKSLSIGGIKREVTKCYLSVAKLHGRRTPFEVEIYNLFTSKLVF